MKIRTILITLLFLTTTFNIIPAENNNRTIYVDDDGGADYTKIQDAIDNASDGDTIFVENGIYNENIIITKPINLISKNKGEAVIHGINTSRIIEIKSDYVSINGFIIENATREISLSCSAIRIHNSSVILQNCTIRDFNGIAIDCSYQPWEDWTERNNQKYEHNIIHYSKDTSIIGIQFNDCEDIVINNNQFISPSILYNSFNYTKKGIDFQQTQNITIVGNTFTNLYSGIHNYDSSTTTITSNIFKNVVKGIDLIKTTNSTITSNRISNATWAITLKSASTHNTINRNSIISKKEYNEAGIIIYSDSNNISYNHISNNTDGIYLSKTQNNQIYRNTFLSNTYDGYFSQKSIKTTNKWRENYWGEPRELPKIIRGSIFETQFYIPWINIDLHPAKQPYNIDI